MPNHRQRFIHFTWISVLILILDQLTKVWAIQSLKFTPAESYLGGLFRIEYSENIGAFLSLGAQLSDSQRFWVFVVAVGLLLVGLFLYLIRGRDLSMLTIVAIALTFSGGLSNLLDRMFRTNGGVVDFLNVGIGSLRTGIFNIADMAIMGGTLILAFGGYFKKTL